MTEGMCAVCKAWLADSGQSDIVKQAKSEERERIERIISEIEDEFTRRITPPKKDFFDALNILMERLRK